MSAAATIAQLEAAIAAHGRAVLVTVAEARGSTPREAGARMVVRADGAIHGSVGGGRLEWDAIAAANRLLGDVDAGAITLDRALGPDLGQCCAGFVRLALERVDARTLAAVAARLTAEDAAQAQPVLLFGAGHVGRALSLALAPLPFRLRWVDHRPEAFPALVPANATTSTAAPEDEIAAADPNALVLVMTHDHALDLAIVAAALRRDFPFLGLIGSRTKKARFRKRLAKIGYAEAALDRIVCPIGVPGIAGKEPAVIAAAVAADLLIRRSAIMGARRDDALRRAG